MKFTKNCAAVTFIAFACVGLATLLGQSEGAGLFGAIIGVGIFTAGIKGDA
jgi:hypothetical protein